MGCFNPLQLKFSFAPRLFAPGGCCGLARKAAVMGTKPMVFPLDADGRVYVLHNEADEPVCTGSRETCYRLLELMLEVKKRADEIELRMTESAEQEVARAASAGA
jgi:hypothetical protein